LTSLPFDVACAVELAPLRAEPSDDAEQVTQAVRGEPLRVEERRDGWARVRTAYDYPGWIREEALLGDALGEARRLIGVPYEWGGLTERGIDCSGLVHLAFARAGKWVPRDSADQEEAGVEVAEDELRPGDVITYVQGGEVDHIAFWTGDGRILHATSREGVDAVVEEPEPESLRGRRHRLVRFVT
jgi:NlpC/P60 family/Bacterial dipeptidyl-peptidase Sh3 domain